MAQIELHLKISDWNDEFTKTVELSALPRNGEVVYIDDLRGLFFASDRAVVHEVRHARERVEVYVEVNDNGSCGDELHASRPSRGKEMMEVLKKNGWEKVLW